MENKSTVEVQAVLQQVEESSMAGLKAAANDPLWIWPIIGVLAGLFLASFGVDSTLLSVGATLVYLIGIGGVVGFVVRRRGVQPSLSDWPSELQRVFVYYAVGCAVALGIIIGSAFLFNFVIAGLLAVPIVSLGGIWYHLTWRSAVDGLASR